MTSASTTQTPWYREPWPWILMAGPATVIVAGAITIWLAISTFDGLVVDDYYKRGLAINQVLARTATAQKLGIAADLDWDPRTGAIALTAASAGGKELPAALRLTLAHATRAGHDQAVTLSRGAGGQYTGRVDPLGPGRWQITLEDLPGEWRVKGALQVPQERDASLVP